MRAVYKYQVDLEKLEDITTILMPEAAEVLSVVNQYGKFTVYALVRTSGVRMVEHQFRVAGTGHPVRGSNGPYDFLGTVMFLEGRLVFHVWDMGEV